MDFPDTLLFEIWFYSLDYRCTLLFDVLLDSLDCHYIYNIYCIQLRLMNFLIPCFLICNVWCSTLHIFFFYVLFHGFIFPSSYLFSTGCLFIPGSSWHVLFLALTDTQSFFIKNLMKFLRLIGQWIFINSIWKHRFSW